MRRVVQFRASQNLRLIALVSTSKECEHTSAAYTNILCSEYRLTVGHPPCISGGFQRFDDMIDMLNTRRG